MKKRFSEDQIIGFLREADKGVPTKELFRKHGFSEASFYLWRSKFGGMDVSDAKRLKALEPENAWLKKLLAERDLELEVMKEINRKMYDPPRVRKGFFGGCGSSVCQNVSGLLMGVASSLALMEIRARQAYQMVRSTTTVFFDQAQDVWG